jgi:hypothetical protein
VPFRNAVLAAAPREPSPLARLQQLFREMGGSAVDCSSNPFIESRGGHLLADNPNNNDVGGGSKAVANPGQPNERLDRPVRSGIHKPEWVSGDVVEGQPTGVAVARSFAAVSAVFVVKATRFCNGGAITKPIDVGDQVSVLFRLRASIVHVRGHYATMVRRTESEWLSISDETISVEDADAAKAMLSSSGIFFVSARMGIP